MKDHCLAATRYWKERWKCCEIGYLNGIPLAGDELTKLIVSSEMSVDFTVNTYIFPFSKECS